LKRNENFINNNCNIFFACDLFAKGEQLSNDKSGVLVFIIHPLILGGLVALVVTYVLAFASAFYWKMKYHSNANLNNLQESTCESPIDETATYNSTASPHQTL
jgi:hypothetical protein